MDKYETRFFKRTWSGTQPRRGVKERKILIFLDAPSELLMFARSTHVADKSEECSDSTWLVSPKKHNHVSNGGKEKWQNTENLAEHQAKEKH